MSFKKAKNFKSRQKLDTEGNYLGLLVSGVMKDDSFTPGEKGFKIFISAAELDAIPSNGHNNSLKAKLKEKIAIEYTKWVLLVQSTTNLVAASQQHMDDLDYYSDLNSITSL